MDTSISNLKELEDIDLYGKVHGVFEKSFQNHEIVFSPNSKSEIIQDPKSKMTFELKVVDGLGKRPHNRPVQPDATDSAVTKEKIESVKANNPFAKPEPHLVIIGDLLGKYRLIMNKYPNVEDHFLLVTKEFVQQDSLLQPIELQMIHTILKNLNGSKELKEQDTKFFAFFNSGPESGYSQFHKHIQFMKLPPHFPVYQTRLTSNADFFIPNEINVNKHPLVNKSASFKHGILKIKEEFKDEDERETILAVLYMFLIRRILNTFNEKGIDREKVSYNFVMMDDWMMTVPRRHAKYQDVWQNSLGYMGLFSARDEEVRQKMLDLGFSKILEECGFPIEEDEEKITYNEYSY
ncbi:DEKNAAC103631 [Brettanomyces naardenensis]|uniref:DEKNAAC103631 n=1 Tax=Brettanomyces naardenensis TaxID=13370 RepID=A0A448YNR0_BRENA|nr:DEKNAAC103631 [Brettanomyces naardenensis]